MKFFHAEGSCSLGIRVLLEEAGASYELALMDLASGDQRTPEYRAVNPKGKVPALLRDDGTLLTEFPAIAFWIARRFPEAGLIPDDIDGQARALEVTDYIVSTLHMRGATLVLRPEKFVSGPAAKALAAHGLEVVEAGLDELARILGDGPYLLGAQFTIADAAAFYLYTWDARCGFTLPPALQEHLSRIEARAAVRRALS